MGTGKSPATKNGKIVTYALFHGSPSTDIEEFDISKAGTNTGSSEHFLFFTDSYDEADDFSYERTETSSMFVAGRGKKGKVYEVDVTMKKPLDLTNLSDTDIKNILKMDSTGGELTVDLIKHFSKGNNQLLKAYMDLDKITKYGYDGFIARMYGVSNPTKEYAVVNVKQVKIKKGK